MSKQAKVDVILNTEQAKAQLKEVQAELKQVKTLRDKAFEAGDIKGYNQLNTQYKKLTSEAGKLEKQAKDVNDVFKNISSASIRELQTAYNQLNRELSQMKRNDPGYAAKQKDVKLLRTELNAATNEMKVHQSGMSRLAEGVNKYFAIVTTGAATMAGFILGLRNAVDVSNLFEKRVDNLSALTGLMGKDLEWLSKEAKDLSTSVIEGNIRITSSANEIVDAYTKVGSKRPELLLVKEDLNAVTKEAMILAAAADGELQPAVDGLTMVLNQFNLPASEARRIINVLAAGSKAGAGEVDYLTEGFEKAGSVASSFGISVEELTGTLETLAPRMTSPEMAGRSLRNIMILLESQTNDKLKPSLVGLGGAFEYLNQQQYSVSELTKLLGQENINAANILMNNTAETKKYTEAVTGTSVALEQAATNTDNNSSKLQQAKNRLEVLTIEFGQKLAPAMTFSTNAFGYFMKAMMAAPAFIAKYQVAMIALAGAILVYNAGLIKSSALKVIDHLLMKEGIGLKIKDAIVLQALIVKEQLYTIWKGNGTVATKVATTAQYAWNAAISANPIGLIITAITALVVAIKLYDKNNDESIRLEKEKREAVTQVKIASDGLQTTLENQKTVIEQLNKLSIDQKRNLLETVDATLKAAEAELILAQAKQENIKKDNTRTTAWQKFTNTIIGFANPAIESTLNSTDAIINGIEASKALDEGINTISESIKQLKGQKSDLNEIVNSEMLADQIKGESVFQLEEKQRYLTTALKNFEKGTDDYIRISKKLSAVSTKLQSGSDSPAGDAKVLDDAFAELGKTITDLDKQINNAIAAGDDPLVLKLSAEKKAAEDLLETYKLVKEQLAKGWSIPELNSSSVNTPDIQKLVSIGAKVVKPGISSQTIKTGLQKVDSGLSEATPEEAAQAVRNRVAAEEAAKQDLNSQIKDASFETATNLNNAIFDVVKNRQQAEFDNKMSLLDKERERELSNKNLTEAQKNAINERYAKKEAALRTAAFKKEQNASAIQALINGALGITKTFAVMGFTPPAWVAAAALAANTLIEIAVIKSAKPPQFYEGGFTAKSNSDTKPVGVVHANEFVVSAAGVRNPSLKPIFDAVDYAQRSGTVSRISLSDLITTTTMQSRAKGGYTSSSTAMNANDAAINPTTSSDPVLLSIIQQNTEAMRNLTNNGVHSIISLFDLDKKQAQKSNIQSATEM